MKIVGVLLAAGEGRRFDPAGRALKLLAVRRSGPSAGQAIALAAARTLCANVAPVYAVVQSAPAQAQADAQGQLRAVLQQAGCTLLPCDAAPAGSGASIACAVRASRGADGWLIALADMPDIQASTVAAVRDALAGGAASAAPFYRGQRGHPVGFAALCGAELAALDGDTGARAVLERHPPQRIDVDDPGILFDVDTMNAP